MDPSLDFESQSSAIHIPFRAPKAVSAINHHLLTFDTEQNLDQYELKNTRMADSIQASNFYQVPHQLRRWANAIAVLGLKAY